MKPNDHCFHKQLYPLNKACLQNLPTHRCDWPLVTSFCAAPCQGLKNTPCDCHKQSQHRCNSITNCKQLYNDTTNTDYSPYHTNKGQVPNTKLNRTEKYNNYKQDRSFTDSCCSITKQGNISKKSEDSKSDTESAETLSLTSIDSNYSDDVKSHDKFNLEQRLCENFKMTNNKRKLSDKNNQTQTPSSDHNTHDSNIKLGNNKLSHDIQKVHNRPNSKTSNSNKKKYEQNNTTQRSKTVDASCQTDISQIEKPKDYFQNFNKQDDTRDSPARVINNSGHNIRSTDNWRHKNQVSQTKPYICNNNISTPDVSLNFNENEISGMKYNKRNRSNEPNRVSLNRPLSLQSGTSTNVLDSKGPAGKSNKTVHEDASQACSSNKDDVHNTFPPNLKIINIPPLTQKLKKSCCDENTMEPTKTISNFPKYTQTEENLSKTHMRRTRELCGCAEEVAEKKNVKNKLDSRTTICECVNKNVEEKYKYFECGTGKCKINATEMVCTAKSCIDDLRICPCQYPPAFRHFSCTGNISGNCNCNEKEQPNSIPN